jgi:hypothetical protein
MTYELALKLKNAGFPQKKLEECDRDICFVAMAVGVMQTESCYIPTLEELIKECGGDDSYFQLINNAGPKRWCACYNDHFCSPMDEQKYHGHGDTAIEAVANLYLELNK